MTRIVLWTTVCILSLTAICVYFLSEDEFTRIVTLGTTIIIVGVLFAFLADDNFDMFSPAFFWGMNFAIFYGLATILPFAMPPENGSYDNVFTLARPHYPTAAATTLLCLVTFFWGYRSKWASQHGKNGSWLGNITASEKSMRTYWGLLLSMGVMAFFILISGGGYNQVTTEIQSPMFYSAAGFLQTGLFIAAPLAVARALERNSPSFWKWAAFLSIATTFAFGIPSGSKTLALLGFIFFVFAWNYRGHRFSRKLALLAVVTVVMLLAFLMPFNAIYRDVMLLKGEQDPTGDANYYSMMKDAAIELGERDPEALIDLSVSYSSQRLSNLSIVATILRRQEITNDYAMGETYFRLIYVLIPRFIWPEKPPLTTGREVAVKLGLGTPEGKVLGIEMSNTSVGLTFIGEIVYNFSIYIAPLIMLLFGMFFRWLYEATGAQRSSSSALAISTACFLWYTLIFSAHESNLAALFAGAIKFLVFLWLIQRFLNFSRQSS